MCHDDFRFSKVRFSRKFSPKYEIFFLRKRSTAFYLPIFSLTARDDGFLHFPGFPRFSPFRSSSNRFHIARADDIFFRVRKFFIRYHPDGPSRLLREIGRRFASNDEFPVIPCTIFRAVSGWLRLRTVRRLGDKSFSVPPNNFRPRDQTRFPVVIFAQKINSQVFPSVVVVYVENIGRIDCNTSPNRQSRITQVSLFLSTSIYANIYTYIYIYI